MGEGTRIVPELGSDRFHFRCNLAPTLISEFTEQETSTFLGIENMEFQMESGGLPVGNYHAEFVGAEPYDQNVEKYGPGVSLKFRVLNGEHEGQEGSRICSKKMTPRSALGKFAVALKGGAIQSGEAFTFTDYQGTKGSIIVAATDSGGSRIETFLRR